jgi:hypothetical protein
LQFIEQKYERLIFLINNAAQTVRRWFLYNAFDGNEELLRSISLLCPNKRRNYYWTTNCLDELKSIISAASSNQNMPVTWHGPNLELVCGLAKLFRFRIHLTMH